ncbi:hypothetical protein SAMN05443662_0726 [Sulfurivirga caldicuralii]|uniref:Uncharacterized protein n=1 Tax=Sulfurivirga caldicuralii TaxID=364032 RepID=A0A1N6EQP9_9GAMM|nr:hypothetical protein [Sulfurivirga caldicuralii]SIN85412.1 hypothetical protein SAMN05443662_0726 [Sulfurivirga caldicuralii]
MKNKPQKLPFTWHYFAMAIGALAAVLSALLGAWSAAAAALGFAIIAHPGLRFTGLTRQVILILFAIMFIFAFPSDPPAVQTAPQQGTESH